MEGIISKIEYVENDKITNRPSLFFYRSVKVDFGDFHNKLYAFLSEVKKERNLYCEFYSKPPYGVYYKFVNTKDCLYVRMILDTQK